MDESPEPDRAADGEEEEIPETFEEEEELPEDDPEALLAQLAKKGTSGLASFDTLAQKAAAVLRGQEEVPVFEEQWSVVDRELGEMAHHFGEGLRYQEPTEEVVKSGTNALDQFEWLQSQMARLLDAVHEEDPVSAVYALVEAHYSLLELFRAYNQLRQVQDTVKYSERPLVSELIRVARLVGQGKLPHDALHDRLNAFCDVQDYFQQLLQNAQPTPGEAGVLETERERLEAALARQNEGLDLLYDYLRESDTDKLENALNLIEEATPVFLELQQRLAGVGGLGESRPCPFCSAPNEPHAKFCEKCSARLPETGTFAAASQASFREGGDQALASNFQRLVEEADKMARGQITVEQFGKTVEGLRSLHERCVKTMLGMKPPPEDTPAEQMRVFEQAKDHAENGLDTIDEGLAELEDYVDGEYGGHAPEELLSHGVDTVIAGAEQLQKVGDAFNQALQLAASRN